MKRIFFHALIILFLVMIGVYPASAKPASTPQPEAQNAIIITVQGASPVATAAHEAILVDATTGAVLYAKDADVPVPPSSMSKMMTMYMVFEALRDGKLHLDEELPVSEHAWKQEGSRMFLNVGQRAKVEDLIRGVIVQSGNDAAVTLAEALGAGSEGNFADILNAKAAKLGLEHSHFANATGLPDPQHVMTVRDLSKVAFALLRDFPEDYHYFSELTFKYNGIEQGNRNPLLYRNMNVDGLKTGHTDAGGFGLTASAVRDGRRLILVLNGLSDMQARADESAHVLDWGFREFGDYPVVKADEHVAELDVWLGQKAKIALQPAENVVVTLPHSARAGLKAVIHSTQPVEAPIAKGQQLGEIEITAPGLEPRTVALIAIEDIPRLGFWARLIAKLKLML